MKILVLCDSIFAGICSQEAIQIYVNINSEDGLAPNRQQAIIWTNDGLV